MDRERLKSFAARGQKLVPWASLVIGVGTGVIMDRSPDQAPMVALSTGVGWFLVSGGVVLGKLIANRLEKRRELATKLVEFSHLAGMQSITQLSIFFAFPFYVQAASLRVGHVLFLALVAAAGLVSLWDPLYEAILARPWARAPVQAFATFAGLNCVLPVLGLSNRLSLYIAAAFTLLGSPVLATLGKQIKEPISKPLLLQVAAAALIPILLVIGAGAAIPPAPLGLTAAAIGTRVEHKTLVDPTATFATAPEQLLCFTSISAPRGLRDQLFHVWRHRSAELDRVPLEVVGGREAGYRTWSIKRKLGDAPSGKWTCTVETAVGQVLGFTSVQID